MKIGKFYKAKGIILMGVTVSVTFPFTLGGKGGERKYFNLRLKTIIN